MEGNHDIEALIARKLEGTITPEESRFLEGVLSTSPDAAEGYKIMAEIWKASRNLNILDRATPEVRWERLRSQIAEMPEKKTRTTWLRYAAVISVFLVLTLTYFLAMKDEWVSIVNHTDNKKSILLLDSSRVTLGSNSTLSYNFSDWSSERKVRLEGNAFFNVKKNGKSFVVESSNAAITVLGTSFDIASTLERTVITCLTGRVKVTNQKLDHEVILTPGLETVVEANLVVKPYRVQKNGAGIENLNFNNTPLETVFETLAEHHGRKITVPAEVNTISFTGNLQGTSLESALKTVCMSAGLKYTMQSDSIRIDRRK